MGRTPAPPHGPADTPPVPLAVDDGLSELNYPIGARRIIAALALVAFCVLLLALAGWESPDFYEFLGVVAVSLFSAGMQISVNAGQGNLPITFVFVLFGVAELTFSETIFLAALASLVHCIWEPMRPPRNVQTVFHISRSVIAAAVADRVFHSPWLDQYGLDVTFRLALATLALCLINSAPSAMVTALTEGEPFAAVWRTNYLWTLPYYMGGAVVAQAMVLGNQMFGWQTVLLIGPVVYLIYRSYRGYLQNIEDEKRHAEEVSSLHLRTIEALALAIEAKDHTTHDHLQRVQVYAMELARELKLSDEDCDALRAAALLHDIGKLAVPEHIISKPGRLTPEEFEKMKIHPVVGAEILERVRFPYPVVPIVRCHHEKWDGTGYPSGVAGEDIPIGARILSAVDCLDALASDRQYRRAIPLDDAMKVVESESGRAFDPRVVEILSRRYIELEKKAQAAGARAAKRNYQAEMTHKKPVAPAAGFETEAQPAPKTDGSMDFLSSIAAARHEVQALFEISQDLGNSLSLDETLSLLGLRLSPMIPHSALAIWLVRDGVLIPEYFNGEDYRLFSALEIPMGQGLSGWVAEKGKPILNGNPSVEPGYLNDPSKFCNLRSAIAVPLEGIGGTLGAMTLYHVEKDAFTKDHLRILLGISTKIGMSIENALRFRQVESSATTDFLTGLPNSRSLFLQLDAELARARREETPLATLVIDLDGFKAVNDRFGHLEGNKMLKGIGTALKSACREYDYVARMGGDEFVILLPGVRPGDVDTKISQFSEVVSRICREHCGQNLISASIGVAMYPRDGTDAEQLLAEADRRMYHEKRSRKNSRVQAPQPAWAETRSTVTLQ